MDQFFFALAMLIASFYFLFVVVRNVASLRNVFKKDKKKDQDSPKKEGPRSD